MIKEAWESPVAVRPDFRRDGVLAARDGAIVATIAAVHVVATPGGSAQRARRRGPPQNRTRTQLGNTDSTTAGIRQMTLAASARRPVPMRVAAALSGLMNISWITRK